MPGCQHCEFRNRPEVCFALQSGHKRFCTLIGDDGRSDYRDLVRRKTLESGVVDPDFKVEFPEELPSLPSLPCTPSIPLVPKPRPVGLARELVVARYREDTAWVNQVPFPVTLYDKCPGSNLARYGEHVIVRHLPNRGREGGTWMDHICMHYDSLAEWTYFVQGTPHADDLMERLALSYTDTTSLTREYSPTFPSDSIKARDRVEWHGGFEVRYGQADVTEQDQDWLARVWIEWMDGPRPLRWWFGFGGEYAVRRDRITDRPLRFWESVRDRVNAANNAGHDLDVRNAWSLELVLLLLWSDPREFPGRLPRVEPVDVQQAARKPCGGCGGSRIDPATMRRVMQGRRK